ncbi:unnamed protein product [Pieris macdunnoughi]|uniref:Uncharacterized protein n=1 Tax=Pieris macdunnoughi TaxID=345717 RepID=A0A821QAM1_9NEOP|nr:unnamed protein product [Pieris macdunnoughi]
MYKLHATVILKLVIDTAAQFPGPGQYAFPQMSAPMSGPMGPMPGHMQMPGPIQMPMHSGAMPIGPHPMNLNSPFQIPQQRLPMVVMPYRSKASDRKHRKRRRMKKKFRDSSSSSSSSESTSSSREYALRSKKKQKRKNRQVLTPVISYVTRNGDVVYQKKVKKDKAGDWLDLGKSKSRFEDESKEEIENNESQEMTIRDLKNKFDLKSKKRKHRH